MQRTALLLPAASQPVQRTDEQLPEECRPEQSHIVQRTAAHIAAAAASLCNSQMCSRLLIVVVLLLLPLQGDECGAQQSSWLPMVLPLRAKECGAMQSSWLLLLPHALLPRSRAQLLLHTLLP